MLLTADFTPCSRRHPRRGHHRLPHVRSRPHAGALGEDAAEPKGADTDVARPEGALRQHPMPPLKDVLLREMDYTAERLRCWVPRQHRTARDLACFAHRSWEGRCIARGSVMSHLSNADTCEWGLCTEACTWPDVFLILVSANLTLKHKKNGHRYVSQSRLSSSN